MTGQLLRIIRSQEFAPQPVKVGRRAYPGAAALLIEADGGGSNGNRCRAWKARLQDFADEFRLTITVTHYPTGASK